MTALVRKQNPDCTIFYNAGHVGPCTRASRDAYTHFELESLPSGELGIPAVFPSRLVMPELLDWTAWE